MGDQKRMGDRSNGIRLYISQAEAVMREIDSRGTCFSRREYVALKYGESREIFLTAYDWFVKELQKRVKRPAGAQYPYWGYREEYGIDWSGENVGFQAEVPADQLVLFDADDWRKILCMQYIGEDEGEERAFRDELSQMGIREEQAVLAGFYPDIKRRIMESWDRLFVNDRRFKNGEESSRGGIQAGMWEIKREWIVKIGEKKEKMLD